MQAPAELALHPGTYLQHSAAGILHQTGEGGAIVQRVEELVLGAVAGKAHVQLPHALPAEGGGQSLPQLACVDRFHRLEQPAHMVLVGMGVYHQIQVIQSASLQVFAQGDAAAGVSRKFCRIRAAPVDQHGEEAARKGRIGTLQEDGFAIADGHKSQLHLFHKLSSWRV